MKRIAVFSSILAAGLLTAAPAFAAESTAPTTPGQPASSTSTPVPPTSGQAHTADGRAPAAQAVAHGPATRGQSR
ncbi:hypothetical protein [Amycolatopsis sp. NPDC050768]|uniref:hypothetical protein n=1 Tax=Amycolatopsis sp. NPDC050768 TaxID=3154839 RepID=UPI0033EDB922